MPNRAFQGSTMIDLLTRVPVNRGSLLKSIDNLLKTIETSENAVMIPTLLKDKGRVDAWELLFVAKILKASVLGHSDLVEFYLNHIHSNSSHGAAAAVGAAITTIDGEPLSPSNSITRQQSSPSMITSPQPSRASAAAADGLVLQQAPSSSSSKLPSPSVASSNSTNTTTTATVTNGKQTTSKSTVAAAAASNSKPLSSSVSWTSANSQQVSPPPSQAPPPQRQPQQSSASLSSSSFTSACATPSASASSSSSSACSSSDGDATNHQFQSSTSPSISRATFQISDGSTSPALNATPPDSSTNQLNGNQDGGATLPATAVAQPPPPPPQTATTTTTTTGAQRPTLVRQVQPPSLLQLTTTNNHINSIGEMFYTHNSPLSPSLEQLTNHLIQMQLLSQAQSNGLSNGASSDLSNGAALSIATGIASPISNGQVPQQQQQQQQHNGTTPTNSDQQQAQQLVLPAAGTTPGTPTSTRHELRSSRSAGCLFRANSGASSPRTPGTPCPSAQAETLMAAAGSPTGLVGDPSSLVKLLLQVEQLKTSIVQVTSLLDSVVELYKKSIDNIAG